ncbi:hypothetical protein [Microbacterium sp. RURRCA19A]|uniref:hypothetical protein n=1 Tax=Microbacterium sp. RURRCA19A TaxID=1907391 RepID=UPI0009553E90|nr:hypothetical protein [Microbacterium sp. RURRCA19A]SIS16976.1 hypothetical protein SAMN05880568_3267 [Microbacterium sp. RURRCA19A]
MTTPIQTVSKKKTTAAAKTKRSKAPEIRWQTEVAHTRHRWWWYVVVAWIGWTLALLLFAYGDWSAGLAVVFAAVALIIINVGKPRTWVVTVDKTAIHIEHPSRRSDHHDLPLQRYRGFTVVDMPQGRRDDAQRAVALLPRFGLRPAQFLVLPTDSHDADRAIQQLSDVLPYDDATAFRRSDAIISGLARWLGLS